MSEEVDALREYGLSEKESLVYLALLRGGSTTVTPLLKITQLQRGSLYDILERLVEKGLVSYVIKADRKNFEAVDPRKLLELLEQKKDAIKEALPALLAKQNLEEPKVTIYKGRKGLKSVYMDTLRSQSTDYVMGASGKLKNALGDSFFARFQREHNRQKRKTTKIIFCEDARGSPSMGDMGYAEIRFVPEEYETPSHTLIYDNKVVIHVLEETPICIMIESQAVAKSYKNFFDNLWKIAKR
ncbi:MAG: helix-turn-helix domain-containing protein [Candidatus Aenigmatarchaeota archaeon]